MAVYCCWRGASQSQAGSGVVAAPPSQSNLDQLTCPRHQPNHPLPPIGRPSRTRAKKILRKLSESQHTLLLLVFREGGQHKRRACRQPKVTFRQKGILLLQQGATKHVHLQFSPQRRLPHQPGRLLNQVSGVLSKTVIVECTVLISLVVTFYAQCDGKFS